MSEAKKKAEEIMHKYYSHTWQSIHNNTEGAKECALIHVEGIIEVLRGDKIPHVTSRQKIVFYQEIKEATEKL